MDHPVRAQLRDGTPVLIRPIRADDRTALADGFRRLSPESRYLRFHHLASSLSERQLKFFTEVDHRDHEALVALDLDADEDPGMGVARYLRLKDEPQVAEAAITVLDEYQGRGVGTLLLAVLVGEARDNGITVFRNYVLAENAPMLEIFHQLGARRGALESGVYTIDLPLPEDPADIPDTPVGRVFKLAARRDLPVLDLHQPPVWTPRG
jgi:GNAT superfamily N-acetyltransferase